MPIYEYYCPGNNTIYQFFAKTLAQGRTVPRCPDNPAYPMVKMMSPFAVAKKSKGDGEPASPPAAGPGTAEDARMEAAMSAMESEFSHVDENDPRAMGRMMRRMAEMTGEKIDGDMEEVVRKLEEGADPDSLEEQFGAGDEGAEGAGEGEDSPAAREEARHRFRARRRPPTSDPKLYDYE
jgi:hypothetical protein